MTPKAPGPKRTLVVLGSELRFELGILVGDQVATRETFTVGFSPLDMEGLAKALESALQKRAEIQAQLDAPKPE